MAGTQENNRRQTDVDDGVHWEITRQHASDISILKESNARQEEVLSSVLRDTNSLREDIGTVLRKISEPPPSTDLTKLIGTTVTVLTMFGALVYAYVSPIAAGQEQNAKKYESLIDMEREQAYQHGMIDSELSMLKKQVGDLM